MVGVSHPSTSLLPRSCLGIQGIHSRKTQTKFMERPWNSDWSLIEEQEQQPRWVSKLLVRSWEKFRHLKRLKRCNGGHRMMLEMIGGAWQRRDLGVELSFV